MIMADLSGLIENRKELNDHLNDILVEPLLQELQNLYNETKDSLSIRDSSTVLLKKYQDKLTSIAEWSKESKHELYEKIVENSGITYISDLIQAILGTQIKIIIKTENPNLDIPKVKFRIPSAENFVHICLVTIARTIWKQTYLMYHNVRSLERQHNIAQLEEIIKKSIGSTIRSCLPLDQLFTYLKENEEQESDEELDEEEIEEEPDEEIDEDEIEEETEDEIEETESEEEVEDEIEETEDEEEIEEDTKADEKEIDEVETDKESVINEDTNKDIEDEESEQESENIIPINEPDVKDEPEVKEEADEPEIKDEINEEVKEIEEVVVDIINNVEKLEITNEISTEETVQEELNTAIEVVKNNSVSVNEEISQPNTIVINKNQSIEDLEKELEQELESIEEQTQTTIIKQKPKQLPLRIVPLNIRNEILRQKRLNDKNPIPKKTDAFF